MSRWPCVQDWQQCFQDRDPAVIRRCKEPNKSAAISLLLGLCVGGPCHVSYGTTNWTRICMLIDTQSTCTTDFLLTVYVTLFPTTSFALQILVQWFRLQTQCTFWKPHRLVSGESLCVIPEWLSPPLICPSAFHCSRTGTRLCGTLKRTG